MRPWCGRGESTARSRSAWPTASSAAHIFQRFFPDADESLAAQFAAAIPEEQLAMAAVQAYLIRYADSAEEAAERVSELVGESPDEMSAAA